MQPGAAAGIGPGIVASVVREHVQLAAFFWSQRSRLEKAQPPNLGALADAEGRLDANLDALRIAGDAAWPFAFDAFADFADPGELFVLGFVAIISSDASRLEACLDLAQANPEARSGLAAAIARVPPSVSAPTVRRLIDARSEVLRAVAAEVLAARRSNPGEWMARLLEDRSPMVRAAACGLAAAAGRQDCAGMVTELAGSSDSTLRLAAAQALLSLGQPDIAVPALRAEAVAAGPRSLEALRTLAGTLPPADFRALLDKLYGTEASRALAIRGTGMTGDPSFLGWLVARMEEPEVAQVAGESFLELFPEADGVEGLFSTEVLALGPAFEGVADGVTPFPAAARIRAWAGL